jgi:hypothetical protein
MTTTILPLAFLILIAFLGYRAATGRVADSRDGQDWQHGSVPLAALSDTSDGSGGTAVRTGRGSGGGDGTGGGKSPVLERHFPVHKVELVAVVGDHHRGDAVLVGQRAQQRDH